MNYGCRPYFSEAEGRKCVKENAHIILVPRFEDLSYTSITPRSFILIDLPCINSCLATYNFSITKWKQDTIRKPASNVFNFASLSKSVSVISKYGDPIRKTGFSFKVKTKVFALQFFWYLMAI